MRARQFGVAEAVRRVVVHQSHRLHVRINDRRADEAEPVRRQELDLASLCRDAVATLAPEAVRRRHQLACALPPDALRVVGDPELLGVALRNLVENALRYTPEGGQITVSAGQEQGETFVSVRDSGPGVAADELDQLTERFYRGRDVRAEGSGLGMALVQRICELHGAILGLRNMPAAADGHGDPAGFLACIHWPAAPAARG